MFISPNEWALVWSQGQLHTQLGKLWWERAPEIRKEQTVYETRGFIGTHLQGVQEQQLDKVVHHFCGQGGNCLYGVRRQEVICVLGVKEQRLCALLEGLPPNKMFPSIRWACTWLAPSHQHTIYLAYHFKEGAMWACVSGTKGYKQAVLVPTLYTPCVHEALLLFILIAPFCQ